MKNRYFLLPLVLAFLAMPLAFTQPVNVSFMLEFNIKGIENDFAEVDGNSVGTYYPADIENYYACIEDSSAAFGIASGNSLDYLSLSKPGNYSIKLSQAYSGNKFIIPVTAGGCSAISNKMPAVDGLAEKYASFIPRSTDITYIILEYSIDLVGDFYRSGPFILTMEKNNSQLIVGSR